MAAPRRGRRRPPPVVHDGRRAPGDRPMNLRVPFLFAALGLLSTADAPADVVETREGLVLEGDVTRSADGAVVVKTDAGEVRLAAGDVASTKAGDGPRAAAKK